MNYIFFDLNLFLGYRSYLGLHCSSRLSIRARLILSLHFCAKLILDRYFFVFRVILLSFFGLVLVILRHDLFVRINRIR